MRVVRLWVGGCEGVGSEGVKVWVVRVCLHYGVRWVCLLYVRNIITELFGYTKHSPSSLIQSVRTP